MLLKHSLLISVVLSQFHKHAHPIPSSSDHPANFPSPFYKSLSHTNSFVLWPTEFNRDHLCSPQEPGRLICELSYSWKQWLLPFQNLPKALVPQGGIGPREALLLWLIVGRATAYSHTCYKFSIAMAVFCPAVYLQPISLSSEDACIHLGDHLSPINALIHLLF